MKKTFYIFSFIFLQIFLISRLAEASNLIITSEDVSRAIKEEFLMEDSLENLELEFFSGQVSFKIADAKSYKLMVSKLDIEELSGKFSCDLEVFVDGAFLQKTTIVGRYHKLIEVYIPSQNISKGEIITKNMLRSISMRQNRVKPVYVTDITSIEGLEARKPLREGRLIGSRDIGNPILIKKGAMVNMIYKSGGIEILAKGEALSDAGKGDKLEVINSKSKKNVYGIVLNKDSVVVK